MTRREHWLEVRPKIRSRIRKVVWYLSKKSEDGMLGRRKSGPEVDRRKTGSPWEVGKIFAGQVGAKREIGRRWEDSDMEFARVRKTEEDSEEWSWGLVGGRSTGRQKIGGKWVCVDVKLTEEVRRGEIGWEPEWFKERKPDISLHPRYIYRSISVLAPRAGVYCLFRDPGLGVNRSFAQLFVIENKQLKCLHMTSFGMVSNKLNGKVNLFQL